MNNKAKPLPMDIIREALEIDPTSKTGLRWKWRPRHHFKTEAACMAFNTRFSREPAGSLKTCNGKKYFTICIGGDGYLAHRIVFAIANNLNEVDSHLDHADGNGTNNDPANIRIASVAENMRNRGRQRNNASGKKGVSFDRAVGRWRARIQVNKKDIHLGWHDDPESASAAYEAAAREHFGEFYREGATT